MLERVVRAVSRAERPVVVFDLDSTLIHTGGRHLAILRAFAERRDDPTLKKLARALDPSAFGWTVDEPLRGRVAPASIEALLQFWREAFFSGRFLHADRALPGAVEFVRALHRGGAWIYYLTARAADTMGAETLRSLHDLGFPLAEGRAVLHMKPASTDDDHAHKRAALHAIAQLGQVVATFENEPAHANRFVEAFPEAIHVLLRTGCSPDAPAPHPALLQVEDFR